MLWAAAIAAVKNQCVTIIYGWLEVINDERTPEGYEKMQGHREYTPTHPHTTEGAGLITHKKKPDITIKQTMDSLKCIVCFPKKQPLFATCHCVIFVILRTMFGVTPRSSIFNIQDKKTTTYIRLIEVSKTANMQFCNGRETLSLSRSLLSTSHTTSSSPNNTFFHAGDSLFHPNRFKGKLMCLTNLFSTEFTQKKKLGVIHFENLAVPALILLLICKENPASIIYLCLITAFEKSLQIHSICIV